MKTSNAHRTMTLVGRKHPALHRPADDVVDLEHAAYLATRMMSTCAAKRGLALAAPQVGHSLRLVCSPRFTWVNPKLVSTGGTQEKGQEACLSIPGRVYEVARWTEVRIEATNVAGVTNQFDIDDQLIARMWQHELDHLDGLLLPDWCPEMRR